MNYMQKIRLFRAKHMFLLYSRDDPVEAMTIATWDMYQIYNYFTGRGWDE